jgi:hypothetical protein
LAFTGSFALRMNTLKFSLKAQAREEPALLVKPHPWRYNSDRGSQTLRHGRRCARSLGGACSPCNEDSLRPQYRPHLLMRLNFTFFAPKFEILNPTISFPLLTNSISQENELIPENLFSPIRVSTTSLNLLWVIVTLSS